MPMRLSILTYNVGSELYRYDKDISDALVGKEFTEAVRALSEQRMVLLAVETDYAEELLRQFSGDVVYRLPEVDRMMVVNLQSNYDIRQGDALFVIAESEPTRL